MCIESSVVLFELSTDFNVLNLMLSAPNAPLDRWEGCLRWYRKAVVRQCWSNFDPKLAFCLFFHLALLLPALQVWLTNSLHAYPWKRHFNEIFSPSRGHLQFWMLWDEWYLNHRLTSGKQGTVIFRLISSLLCIQIKFFWLLSKRTNYMNCIDLLFSCVLLVKNIRASQANWGQPVFHQKIGCWHLCVLIKTIFPS